MKSRFFILGALASSFLFYQCTFDRLNFSKNNDNLLEHQTESEEQDGIREAQEMEFNLTKDVTLGYVPKDRLIRATNDLYIARKNGLYPRNGATALSWTERGPYLDLKGPGGNGRGTIGNPTLSGRIRSIWVDLKDVTNRTVWVGSASGGLWKTSDITAGPPATWTSNTDFLGNMSVMSICQDPTGTQNTMYFGTGEKTNNADAVRGGGIWKSTDNGATWTLLSNTTGFNNVSKIICDASGNVYVATIGGNGFYRSTNRGISWTDIGPVGLNQNVIDMNLSSTGRLHVICGYSGNGGYRYTDNPSTVTSGSWISPVTSFTSTDNNSTICSSGTTVYAMPADNSGQTDQIWKSTDGGANWAITATTPPVTGATPLSSSQGWFCQGLAVDPTNPSNVMVGGLNTYLSNDGGGTWAPNSVWVTGVPGSTNYIHADHQVFVWSTGNQLLCGGDGGLFYSADGGGTFNDRNQGLRIKQFYSCAIHPTLPNYFLAGAQDNGVHQLNGAGLASSFEVLGGDGGFVHIDENEPSYQFGAYTYSQYRRSIDGGASFSSFNFSNSAGQFINPTDYDDMNNNFYGAWTAGNYLRWINAPVSGANFPTPIAAFNGGTITHVKVSHYTSNRVFFGINNGKIVQVDAANTASPTATDITASSGMSTNVSCVAIGTTDNNLLATFSNYGVPHVWISNSGGGASGWTNINGNLPDIPVRWAMFNPEDNTKAMLATEMGIYETNLINGAATLWVQNAAFPTVKTNMFKYRYSDNTILAATHGRGLWTSTYAPTAPYVRFASSYTFSPINVEATTNSGSVCRNYKDYTVNMHIDQAPVGTANVTLSIAGGATATQGVDFDFTTNGNFAAPSSVLTFPNGGTADQPITIRVYDDAEVENQESFTLTYTVSGGSNALAAPSSQSYTFFIGDNDFAPTVSSFSGNYSIGTSNTTLANQSPFRGDLAKFRIQYLFTAAELNAAGIAGAGNITSMKINVTTKQSTQPFTGFSIALGSTAATTMGFGFPAASFTQVYSSNYSSVLGDNTFAFTTPFVWDGTSNVVVNFCFDNGAATSALDIMDGTSAPLGTGIRGASYSNGGAASGCLLAGAFVSDRRITATFGASAGNPVESVLNNNRSEYVSNNGTYHFYNGYNIISKINNSTSNLGCVGSSIFEAGNTWSAFGTGQRSAKVFLITPTTNSGASYTIGLYYTLAELNGRAPSTVKIAKTNAATMALANATNTVSATTTFTSFGTGYLFEANFTGFSKFFLVDNFVVLPVQLVSFSGVLNNQDHSELLWRTTNQFNLRNFEVERSYDGLHFTSLGFVPAQQGADLSHAYTFTDRDIAKALNYYQLKMIDVDGRVKLSTVVLINNNKALKWVELVQNPVINNIVILINNRDKATIFAELYNWTGQLISKSGIGKADGRVTLPFTTANLAKGTYMLRISAASKVENFKISKL